MADGPYLFDPDAVADLLESLPNLEASIGAPHDEGEPSEAFPAARKARRQVYRVLGNAHFPHLRDLLGTLDFCLEQGFTQPTVLKTRAGKPFAEALAELTSAEHFLLRGLSVCGLDEGKGQESVPDLLLGSDGYDAAVEVYCPRAWEGLSLFGEESVRLLKDLDLAFDYEFEIRAEQMRHFDEGRLLQSHPQELAVQLEREIRNGLVADLVEGLTSDLDGGQTDLRNEREHAGLNLRISVELHSIQPSRSRLPIRRGTFSPPTITGHSLEAMFARLADRVARKAARGQAVGHASLSLLLVELSRSELQPGLSHDYYRGRFAELLRDSRLGQGLAGYHMVAFCEWVAWRQPLRLHFLMREDGVAMETARPLFDELAS